MGPSYPLPLAAGINPLTFLIFHRLFNFFYVFGCLKEVGADFMYRVVQPRFKMNTSTYSSSLIYTFIEASMHNFCLLPWEI